MFIFPLNHNHQQGFNYHYFQYKYILIHHAIFTWQYFICKFFIINTSISLKYKFIACMQTAELGLIEVSFPTNQKASS